MRTYVEGDRPTLEYTCRKNTDLSVIDLTSYNQTPVLHYRIEGGTAQAKNMSVVAPASGGKVRYTFGVDELTPGRFRGQIELTDGTGKPFRCHPPIEFIVEKKV